MRLNIYILVLSLGMLFTGCSVKNLDSSLKFNPPIAKKSNINNRIAVISKLNIITENKNVEMSNTIKNLIINTILSTGMYENVSYGYDKVDTSNNIVDEYYFDIEPSYTRDIDWVLAWPGVYPCPGYWPIQPYESKINSKIKLTSIIEGKSYEKTFFEKEEVSQYWYGFFKTEKIENAIKLTTVQNLQNIKSYLQNDIKIAILNGAGEYHQEKQYYTSLKNEYNTVKLQYNFKDTKIKNANSFALIIGINKYKQNTNVEYADLSALAFEELAQKTLGIPKENIITLLNDDATSGQIKANIEFIKELSDRRGNLYVYFAGHGVPGKDGSTYLLPSDMSADSIHLEPNLKLDTIYAKLAKAQAKNVFVFMDSCFSGKDDSGSLLYKGVAPVLRTKKNVINANKLTILTAGKSTDFANDFESKQQRMFTYFLIKELSQGKKNLNKIYPDIQSDVKRASLKKGIGYKQVPQIYGNKKVSLY